MIELVRTGQAAGDFAPVASPEMVSFTLFGVINELPVWYRPDGPKQPSELAAELAALILAALRPAGSGHGAPVPAPSRHRATRTAAAPEVAAGTEPEGSRTGDR